MALNIKSPEVVRLAEEVARLAGETKTEAIRKALEERRGRLQSRAPERPAAESIRRFLEREVWSQVPHDVLGKRLPKSKRERILGYGPEGV